MASSKQPSPEVRCLQIAQAACCFVIVTALAVIVGWIADYSPLKSIVPGFVAMKSNTAVALCLASISLLFSAHSPDSRSWKKLSCITALLAGLIGALTLG